MKNLDSLYRKSSTFPATPKAIGVDSRSREKQLKTRLAKWRFDTKNVKGDMMLEIARKQAKRKRVDGKDSAFCVNEKPVEQQKIRRYLRRNNISEGELLSMASPCNGEISRVNV